MSVSVVHNARQSLGSRLREIRTAASLTQRDLGRLTGWHSSKISKIEYGKQAPTKDDIGAWCRQCGASDQIPDLVATLQALDEMWIEWKRSLRTGTRHRQREQIAHEGGAQLLRWYESMLIPGILHTADYARGVMSKIIDFYGVPDDLDQGVEARMERQRILYRGDHRLHLVMAEQCLRTVVVDAPTTVAQLDRLLAVQGMARLSIGIIPRGTPFQVLANSFILFDEAKVMVETISAELTVTQPREIELYSKAFQTLARQAVYGPGARQLITEAIKVLDTSRR